MPENIRKFIFEKNCFKVKCISVYIFRKPKNWFDWLVLHFTMNTLGTCISLLLMRFYFYTLAALTPLFYRVKFSLIFISKLALSPALNFTLSNMISIYLIKECYKDLWEYPYALCLKARVSWIIFILLY